MYNAARTIKKEKSKQRKLDKERRVRKRKTKNALERKKEVLLAQELNKEIGLRKSSRLLNKTSKKNELKKLGKEMKKLEKKMDKERKKLVLKDEEQIEVEEGQMVHLNEKPVEQDKEEDTANVEMPAITTLIRSSLEVLNSRDKMPEGNKYKTLSPIYEDSDYDSDKTVDYSYSPDRSPLLPLPGRSSGHSSNHTEPKPSDNESNQVDLSDTELGDGDSTEPDEWLPRDDDKSSDASDPDEDIAKKKTKVKSTYFVNDKSKDENVAGDLNVSNEVVILNKIASDRKDSYVVENYEKESVHNNNDEKSKIQTDDIGDHNYSVTNLKDVNKSYTISSDIENLHNEREADKTKDKQSVVDHLNNNIDVTNLKDVKESRDTISSKMEILHNGVETSKTDSDDELPEVILNNDSDVTEPYSDSDMDMDSFKFKRFFRYLTNEWEEDLDHSSSESEYEVDQAALDKALVKLMGRPSGSQQPPQAQPTREGGSTRGRKRRAPLFPPQPSKRARKNWGSDGEMCSDGSESSLPDIGMMNEIQKVMQGTSTKKDDKKSTKVKIPNALEEDEEEYGVAEVYDDYMPLKLKLGCQHPDPVVETASLASVEPTDITYQLSLPEDTIREGKLSALQLEAIVYSSQAHEQTLPDGSRAGFLIGDGAGVGKGRTVAGVIFENWLKGHKRAIWISISNDLKLDAERDLKDIGAPHIKVHLLKDFKYVKLSTMATVSEGVMFLTYTALSSRGGRTAKDSVFSSRLEQLLDWCGHDFDGVIVLDECHRAKNLCPPGGKGKPTKTGLNVYKLQERLPKARLVYASATGATEPKNMAYMVRLGLWGKGTAFDSFSDFIKVVEKGGVGAMEIVAMDMKLRGMYIARQLSFRGVTFTIEEVPLEQSLMTVYNDSVELWVEAKRQFQSASDYYCALGGGDPRMKKNMWAQFWGAHQRFFKYLCIAAKVDRAVAIALGAVGAGQCCVVGLQSTGEARTLVQLGQQADELTEFLSTAEGVFKNLVETQWPGVKDRPLNTSVASQLQKLQVDFLKKVEQLGKRLPRNMLDDLVDKLGGAEKVAEMTGRKGRLVKATENGHQQVYYESRCDGDATLDTLNVLEKQRFMAGDKVIAVISEAASSGISLQSDRRVENQRRRVHITLELPWSADRAIQQFGRTHRSNQVNAPEYIFLISDLAGERRFASTVAKRLESLGALTHGDRRATETRDLSQFNIDNKYGKEALTAVLHAVRGGVQRVPAPPDYADFVRHARQALENVGLIAEDEGTPIFATPVDQHCNMSKFLNRILGMPVALQNCLFKYFVDNLAKVTEEAKRKGSFDQGIVDVRGARCVGTLCVLREHATGHAPVQLHTVLVDRGMDWDAALRKCNAESGSFYAARQSCGHRRNILLYVGARGQVYRPGTGLQRAEPFAEIQRKYEKISGANWEAQAQSLWSRNHLEARSVCSHAFFRPCQSDCKWGLRERTYHILAGSVLAVWDKLEFQRMQVVRAKTSNAGRIVGTLIPASCVDDIGKSLKSDAVSVSTKRY